MLCATSLRHFSPRARLAWLIVLALALPGVICAQDDAYSDPNETPLGDVARNQRKKPQAGVIDDDNIAQVMKEAEGRHSTSATLRYLMSGDAKGFQVSAPDATCSLSFTANAKSLLSSQYAQMNLPASDVERLVGGVAAVEGGTLTVSVFNATDWHVSELAVALTVVRKSEPAEADGGPDTGSSDDSDNKNRAVEVPTSRNGSEKWGIPGSSVSSASSSSASGPSPSSASAGQQEAGRVRKKQDVTVLYRMRATAVPFDKTVFSAPLNLELSPGDEWHWAIVEAKGYPPQSYVASLPANPPTLTAVPAAASLLVPQDAALNSLSQGPQ